MVSSVLLPEPLGPMIATSSPAVDGEVDVVAGRGRRPRPSRRSSTRRAASSTAVIAGRSGRAAAGDAGRPGGAGAGAVDAAGTGRAGSRGGRRRRRASGPPPRAGRSRRRPRAASATSSSPRVVLEPGVALHRLDDVAAVGLDELVHVDPGHPQRHEHLDDELVAGRLATCRAACAARRRSSWPPASVRRYPFCGPLALGVVGLDEAVALEPLERRVDLPDVERPHLPGAAPRTPAGAGARTSAPRSAAPATRAARSWSHPSPELRSDRQPGQYSVEYSVYNAESRPQRTETPVPRPLGGRYNGLRGHGGTGPVDDQRVRPTDGGSGRPRARRGAISSTSTPGGTARSCPRAAR